MKSIEIRNITKGNIITKQGVLANNFFARLKGLIGKKELKENEGLCIKPCKGVHTFFMQFRIDVVFIDKDGLVCEVIKDLKPFKFSKYISNSSYVIELSSGKCEKVSIELGDIVDIT